MDLISPNPSVSASSSDDSIYTSFPGYKKCSPFDKKSLKQEVILENNKHKRLVYYDSDSVSCTSMEVATILKDAPGPTFYFSSSSRKKLSKNSKKLDRNSVTPRAPSTAFRHNKTPVYMTMTNPLEENDVYVNMKSFQPFRKEQNSCIQPRTLSNFVQQSLDSFLNGINYSKNRDAVYFNDTKMSRTYSRSSQGSQESSSSNSTLCDPGEFQPSLHSLLRTHTLYQFSLNTPTSHIESLTIKTAKLTLTNSENMSAFKGPRELTNSYMNVVKIEKAVYNAPDSQDTYYFVQSSRIQSDDILVEVSTALNSPKILLKRNFL